MVSCEHFIAKPDELLASVLAAHSNVGILQTQSKGVRKPTVGILSCHDPGLPDAVKLPGAPGCAGSGGLRSPARPSADWCRDALPHRCYTRGSCDRHRVSDRSGSRGRSPLLVSRSWLLRNGGSGRVCCAGLGSFFFSKWSSPFCVLLEFTQKTGGYPPSLRKEICKLFVNGCEKSYCTQNAIALEEKYRVL